MTHGSLSGTIFAEKLLVENGKITAPTYTESIKLMFRIGKSIGNSKGNKVVDIDFTVLRPNQI